MANFDDIFENQADNAAAMGPFDKDAWAERKQKDREAAYRVMDDTALLMGTDSGMLQSYLDVQARFDRYSVGNALLVAAQMPEATRLADFDTWREAGVYVKKGAIGITIMEPGKEYTREDGGTGVFYNPKKVFDISQTTSRQPMKAAVSHDDRLLIKALINNAPCKFSTVEELPQNAVYRKEENTIYVRKGLDGPTIFRALSQELTRAHIDAAQRPCVDTDFSAVCVSYMLCKRNGVSVEGYDIGRLPEAFRDMDARGIREQLGLMRDIAGDISMDMNRVFEIQQRSQKNRDREAR